MSYNGSHAHGEIKSRFYLSFIVPVLCRQLETSSTTLDVAVKVVTGKDLTEFGACNRREISFIRIVGTILSCGIVWLVTLIYIHIEKGDSTSLIHMTIRAVDLYTKSFEAGMNGGAFSKLRALTTHFFTLDYAARTSADIVAPPEHILIQHILGVCRDKFTDQGRDGDARTPWPHFGGSFTNFFDDLDRNPDLQPGDGGQGSEDPQRKLIASFCAIVDRALNGENPLYLLVGNCGLRARDCFYDGLHGDDVRKFADLCHTLKHVVAFSLTAQSFLKTTTSIFGDASGQLSVDGIDARRTTYIDTAYAKIKALIDGGRYGIRMIDDGSGLKAAIGSTFDEQFGEQSAYHKLLILAAAVARHYGFDSRVISLATTSPLNDGTCRVDFPYVKGVTSVGDFLTSLGCESTGGIVDNSPELSNRADLIYLAHAMRRTVADELASAAFDLAATLKVQLTQPSDDSDAAKLRDVGLPPAMTVLAFVGAAMSGKLSATGFDSECRAKIKKAVDQLSAERTAMDSDPGQEEREARANADLMWFKHSGVQA
ncbi:MAG: hypothetical protein LBB38_01820 [Puniceicoccales bacterium]|nr:hypothetical protein [Puniceicoccales bacterium]